MVLAFNKMRANYLIGHLCVVLLHCGTALIETLLYFDPLKRTQDAFLLKVLCKLIHSMFGLKEFFP